ncbi:MAG: hypothetical protein ACRD1T_02045, partial [Acidimicrobiia bacterium]
PSPLGVSASSRTFQLRRLTQRTFGSAIRLRKLPGDGVDLASPHRQGLAPPADKGAADRGAGRTASVPAEPTEVPTEVPDRGASRTASEQLRPAVR